MTESMIDKCGRYATRLRPPRLNVVLSLCGFAMLAACATNALRVEGATAVGTAASNFTTSATAALDDARARRLQANATLVASDPSCQPYANVFLYIARPGVKQPAGPPAPLCANGATPRAGYDLVKLDLRPLPEETLKPTILLIGAIGDYGAAMAKVAGRADVDVGKELTDIAGKASKAAAIANGLLKLNLPDATKLLATDQAKAAIALAQFASNLAEEQAKVRDIRALVASRGDKVDALIPLLKKQLADWLLVNAQGDAQIVQNNLLRAYRDGRRSWDYDRRLAAVTAINQSRAEAAAYPQRLATLQGGLDFLPRRRRIYDACCGVI